MLINLLTALIFYVLIRYHSEIIQQIKLNMRKNGVNGLRVAQGRLCEEISNDFNNPLFILQSHFYLVKKQTQNEGQAFRKFNEFEDIKTIFSGLDRQLEILRRKVAILNYLSVSNASRKQNQDLKKNNLEFVRTKERMITLAYWLRSMILDRKTSGNLFENANQSKTKEHPIDVIISKAPNIYILGPIEVIVRSLTELSMALLDRVKDPYQIVISAEVVKDNCVLNIQVTGSSVIKTDSSVLSNDEYTSSLLMIESVLNRGLGWKVDTLPVTIEHPNQVQVVVKTNSWKKQRFH